MSASQTPIGTSSAAAPVVANVLERVLGASPWSIGLKAFLLLAWVGPPLCNAYFLFLEPSSLKTLELSLSMFIGVLLCFSHKLRARLPLPLPATEIPPGTPYNVNHVFTPLTREVIERNFFSCRSLRFCSSACIAFNNDVHVPITSCVLVIFHRLAPSLGWFFLLPRVSFLSSWNLLDVFTLLTILFSTSCCIVTVMFFRSTRALLRSNHVYDLVIPVTVSLLQICYLLAVGKLLSMLWYPIALVSTLVLCALPLITELCHFHVHLLTRKSSFSHVALFVLMILVALPFFAWSVYMISHSIKRFILQVALTAVIDSLTYDALLCLLWLLPSRLVRPFVRESTLLFALSKHVCYTVLVYNYLRQAAGRIVVSITTAAVRSATPTLAASPIIIPSPSAVLLSVVGPLRSVHAWLKGAGEGGGSGAESVLYDAGLAAPLDLTAVPQRKIFAAYFSIALCMAFAILEMTGMIPGLGGDGGGDDIFEAATLDRWRVRSSVLLTHLVFEAAIENLPRVNSFLRPNTTIDADSWSQAVLVTITLACLYIFWTQSSFAWIAVGIHSGRFLVSILVHALIGINSTPVSLPICDPRGLFIDVHDLPGFNKACKKLLDALPAIESVHAHYIPQGLRLLTRLVGGTNQLEAFIANTPVALRKDVAIGGGVSGSIVLLTRLIQRLFQAHKRMYEAAMRSAASGGDGYTALAAMSTNNTQMLQHGQKILSTLARLLLIRRLSSVAVNCILETATRIMQLMPVEQEGDTEADFATSNPPLSARMNWFIKTLLLKTIGNGRVDRSYDGRDDLFSSIVAIMMRSGPLGQVSKYLYNCNCWTLIEKLSENPDHRRVMLLSGVWSLVEKALAGDLISRNRACTTSLLTACSKICVPGSFDGAFANETAAIKRACLPPSLAKKFLAHSTFGRGPSQQLLLVCVIISHFGENSTLAPTGLLLQPGVDYVSSMLRFITHFNRSDLPNAGVPTDVLHQLVCLRIIWGLTGFAQRGQTAKDRGFKFIHHGTISAIQDDSEDPSLALYDPSITEACRELLVVLSEAGSKVMTPAQAALLPVTSLELDRDECVVCLLPLLRNQRAVVLPCAHYFHEACLKQWVYVDASCPNCRKRVIVEEDVDGLHDSGGEGVGETKEEDEDSEELWESASEDNAEPERNQRVRSAAPFSSPTSTFAAPSSRHPAPAAAGGDGVPFPSSFSSSSTSSSTSSSFQNPPSGSGSPGSFEANVHANTNGEFVFDSSGSEGAGVVFSSGVRADGVPARRNRRR